MPAIGTASISFSKGNVRWQENLDLKCRGLRTSRGQHYLLGARGVRTGILNYELRQRGAHISDRLGRRAERKSRRLHRPRTRCRV